MLQNSKGNRMKKRLTNQQQEKIEGFWGEVSYVENHYKEFSCYPNQRWNSHSDCKSSGDGEGNLGIHLSKTDVELAYEEIAGLFSKLGMLVGFDLDRIS